MAPLRDIYFIFLISQKAHPCPPAIHDSSDDKAFIVLGGPKILPAEV
jgi:hypothetical protein